MSGVIVCVEADQIALEDTEEQLFPNREDTVDLAAGERRVQEEADFDVFLCVSNLLAEHLRQEHQMVVVHPDQVTILYILDDFLGEQAIHLAVC